MALNGGSRLGHYSVTVLIGAGGVGEMYRARDTSLDRDGALKVPAPAFSDDTGLNPDEFKIRVQLTQDGLIAKPSTNRAILTRVPATRETFNGRQGWSEGQEQGPEAEGREGRRKEEAETGQTGESQTRLSVGVRRTHASRTCELMSPQPCTPSAPIPSLPRSAKSAEWGHLSTLRHTCGDDCGHLLRSAVRHNHRTASVSFCGTPLFGQHSLFEAVFVPAFRSSFE